MTRIAGPRRQTTDRRRSKPVASISGRARSVSTSGPRSCSRSRIRPTATWCVSNTATPTLTRKASKPTPSKRSPNGCGATGSSPWMTRSSHIVEQRLAVGGRPSPRRTPRPNTASISRPGPGGRSSSLADRSGGGRSLRVARYRPRALSGQGAGRPLI